MSADERAQTESKRPQSTDLRVRRMAEQIDEQKGSGSLTDRQRAQIERNRQRALLLRQTRQQAKPYSCKRTKPSTLIDTGGGFLLDPAEEEEQREMRKVIHQPGAVLDLAEVERLICDECGKEFLESSLHDTFCVSVCDTCRDSEEKHKLITKSQAKEKYLLKDVDLDKREPILRFIEKKNPHNEKWGRMKLYVAERAKEVWGDDEQIEEERARRQDSKDKIKTKRFNKKIKDLRMAVRSSLWTKELGAHEHTYGPETYDEDEDTYTKTCDTCGHVLSYEKM